jgi:hypothetical protein
MTPESVSPAGEGLESLQAATSAPTVKKAPREVIRVGRRQKLMG